MLVADSAPGVPATHAQLYVSGCPSGSLDPDPLSTTCRVSRTVTSGPAFATGGMFGIRLRHAPPADCNIVVGIALVTVNAYWPVGIRSLTDT